MLSSLLFEVYHSSISVSKENFHSSICLLNGFGFLFLFWCCIHPEIIWFGVSFLNTGFALWNGQILSAYCWVRVEYWESQPCPAGWSLLWWIKNVKTLGSQTTRTLGHCCLIPTLVFQTFPGTWVTHAGQSRGTHHWKLNYVLACSEDWFFWKTRA